MLFFVLIAMLSLLFSCSTVAEFKAEEVVTDEDYAISFIIDGRYYAELRRMDDSFFLFSPELMIKSEKLNSYTTKEGNPVFSSPKRNLNIKLYPEILYFALDGYYAYLDYHMVGKNRGDYYPFI